MHNLDLKTELKKTIKTFLTSVKDNNKDEAEANYKLAQKKLDKASKCNHLNKNTVSRRKSRYTKLITSIA